MKSGMAADFTAVVFGNLDFAQSLAQVSCIYALSELIGPWTAAVARKMSHSLSSRQPDVT